MTAILGDLSVKGMEAGESKAAGPLGAEELRKTHAYWRACNYLAAGMIYLRDNPLLREPLKEEHVKRRLLGHWGASPGLSFTYIHVNRLIKQFDDMRKVMKQMSNPAAMASMMRRMPKM